MSLILHLLFYQDIILVYYTTFMQKSQPFRLTFSTDCSFFRSYHFFILLVSCGWGWRVLYILK